MILARLGHTASFALQYKLQYPTLPRAERAVWLQRRVEKMGPTYVKLGQFIATRSDLIEDVDMKLALSRLHDDVDPMPWETVEAILLSQNININDFSDIQRVPLASASIGQVHRATLGKKDVVIKIRRPDIGGSIDTDIQTIKAVLQGLALFTKDKKNVLEAMRMADDVRASLIQESDLRIEMKNLERFAEARLPNTYIPKIYDAYATENIMVMEYVPSIKFTDAKIKDRKALALGIMTCFVEQFLTYGVIHGDPHPGNVALAVDLKSFVMYDFGKIVLIPESTRTYFKLLVFELMNDNVDGVIDILLQVPDLVTIVDTAMVRKYIKSYMKYIKTIDLNELKNVMGEGNQDLPIKFNNKIFEIIRIFGTVEGICKALDSDFTYDDVLAKYSGKMFTDTDFMFMKSMQDIARLFDII